MSSSVGMGCEVTSVGLSVVPAIVIFSQGRKKMTLPSLVAGSSSPMLSGLEEMRGLAHNGNGLVAPRVCPCTPGAR